MKGDDFLYQYDGLYNPTALPPFGFLRFLHASPDAPRVDVYADKRLLARNVMYSEMTRYFRLLPGSYMINVFVAGKTDKIVTQVRVSIGFGQYLTIAAINKVSNISTLIIPEPIMITNPKRGYLRFVHLSPNAPNVDFKLANGKTIFTDVTYKQITSYAPFTPRRVEIIVTPTKSNREVIRFPAEIMPGMNQTAYILGLVNGRPALSSKVVMDRK